MSDRDVIRLPVPVNGNYKDGLLPDLAPLQILDFITLAGKPVPMRSWLVPGWMPMGKVTGLYGPSATGKTTLAQMLMTSCATGHDWLGLKAKRVRSIGVFCEDDRDDLHERQHNINEYFRCAMGDLEDMQALPRLGENNSLMVFDGNRPNFTPFFHQILNLSRDFGAELVVLDTAADVFAGNQNDTVQVRTFVQFALGQIARSINGVVLLCAHPSREGQRSGSGESGSVQWDSTFRSRAYLSRPAIAAGEEEDPNARVLSRMKSNFSARGEEIRLLWRQGVFKPIGRPDSMIDRLAVAQKADRVFLALLSATCADGTNVSPNPAARNYAPRVFTRYPNHEGVSEPALARAMQRLREDGRIETETYGRPSDPRVRLVIA